MAHEQESDVFLRLYMFTHLHRQRVNQAPIRHIFECEMILVMDARWNLHIQVEVCRFVLWWSCVMDWLRLLYSLLDQFGVQAFFIDRKWLLHHSSLCQWITLEFVVHLKWAKSNCWSGRIDWGCKLRKLVILTSLSILMSILRYVISVLIHNFTMFWLKNN